MLPINLYALTRVCKQQIPLLFNHTYDSSCTWVCVKTGGKQLIAPECLTSTCNSLTLPNWHLHIAAGTTPTTGQGTKGAQVALKLYCALESCSTATLRLCRWLFLCGFSGVEISVILQSASSRLRQVLSLLLHCMHWKERDREMFIHMHITILPKAIKYAEIWKGQLAEERLVHNKALVCWYLEQTQFCPAKLSTWRICVWVVGLKLPSNFKSSSSKKKWNNVYKCARWGKASIKSLFSIFILFPLPVNVCALSFGPSMSLVYRALHFVGST